MTNQSTTGEQTGPAKQSGSLFAWGLVFGTALLFLAVFLASGRFAKLNYGPQSVAAGFNSVWVYGQGNLWRLSAQGATLARYSGLRNGLGRVVDRMVAAGPLRVFLHDSEAKTWRDCTAGESGVALSCEPLFAGEWAARNLAEAAIAFSPDARRFVFADFTAGELLLFDTDKQFLGVSKGVGALEGGSVVWLDPQELGVIAADQPALHAAELAGNQLRPMQVRWQLSASDEVRKGYVWSAAWGAERKSWYLSYSPERRAQHELWKVDREGKRVDRIALGGGGVPAQVVNLDKETVLVPDVVAGRLHQVVSWANDRVSDFGDEQFRAAMEQAHTRYALFAPLQWVSGVLAVLVPIALALFFVRREARRHASAQGSAAELPPLGDEAEFWFTPDEKQAVLRRRLVLTASFAIAALLILQFRLFGGFFQAGPYVLGLLTTVLVLAVLAGGGLLWWRQRELGPRGLGIKGQEVYFDPGDGKIEQYTRAELLTDGQRMLLGKHLLWQRAGGIGLRSEWDAAELQAYLVGGLPPQAQRSTGSMLWLYFRRNPLVFCSIVLPLLLAAAQLFALPFLLR